MNDSANYSAPPVVVQIQRRSLITGIVTLAFWGVGAFLNPHQIFQSYLVGYLFWAGIALGSLAVIMLQYLTGGEWGVVTRRPLEAAARTLPVLVLLFIPLAFGMQGLYTRAHAVQATGATTPSEDPYLLTKFFLLRAAIYFVVWLLLAYLLTHWSTKQDRTADPRWSKRLQALSGPGLVVYGFTATFAGIDWVMSLQADWNSTIFGMLVMGSQVLSAFAFIIIITVLLSAFPPLSKVLVPKHFHDLGKLLLTFVMLWAYFAFSQLLIIWAGNLPEEITFYMPRFVGPWRWIGFTMIVFEFALPFVLLLSRDLKRHARGLAVVAVILLCMRFIDLFWLVGPAFQPASVPLPWMELLVTIGLGGIWLAVYMSQLKRQPLLPVNEPALSGVLDHARVHQKPDELRYE